MADRPHGSHPPAGIFARGRLQRGHGQTIHGVDDRRHLDETVDRGEEKQRLRCKLTGSEILPSSNSTLMLSSSTSTFTTSANSISGIEELIPKPLGSFRVISHMSLKNVDFRTRKTPAVFRSHGEKPDIKPGRFPFQCGCESVRVDRSNKRKT